MLLQVAPTRPFWTGASRWFRVFGTATSMFTMQLAILASPTGFEPVLPP
jgi:hypothetical protein